MYSTVVATTITMNSTIDTAKENFMTDHGSTAETVRRTVRGPFFFLPFPPSTMFFTPIFTLPELARTVFAAFPITEVAPRLPPFDPWEPDPCDPEAGAPTPWEPV